MFDQTTLKDLDTLQYSRLWLECGLLQHVDLVKQIEDFETGDDPNQEHYRYRTFCNFLKNQSSLGDSTLVQIIEVLKEDVDKSMASSAILVLLKTEYLTQEQVETVEIVAQSYFDRIHKHVARIKKERLG